MREELIKLLDKSYAPYSKFHVSAIVETNDGKYIPGVNVENASYGATICAERNAIMAAITLGKNNLSKRYAINELTTVYKKDTSSKQNLTPEEDIYDWITRTFKDGSPMNLLLYINKQKARQGAMSPGLKPLVFDILNGLPESIPDEHDLARLNAQNDSYSLSCYMVIRHTVNI